MKAGRHSSEVNGLFPNSFVIFLSVDLIYDPKIGYPRLGNELQNQIRNVNKHLDFFKKLELM